MISWSANTPSIAGAVEAMGEVKRLRGLGAARAEADIAIYRKERSALARLPLGGFSEAGMRSLLLRHILLKVPLPLTPLIWLARMGSEKTASKLDAVEEEAAYWRHVKARLNPLEWASLTHGPVVLMYHAIGMRREPTSRYVVPEPRFRRQMAWLRARGYRFISLRDLAKARARGQLPPPRSVILTFDDGYRDNEPVLRHARTPATIFVVTGAMGATNCWDAGGQLAGRALLTWEEARTLSRAGIEVGAHTRTHPALTEVCSDQLEQEVRGSMEDLQRELGPAPYTFAYPHGRFNAQSQGVVAAAGFIAACCSRGGVNDPYVSDFELRRVEVKGTDSFWDFVLMVWLGRRITPLQFLRSLVVG
jgi:peptidoglycan/xylan/chitin deacetylase (PgdA/CDA1 family)